MMTEQDIQSKIRLALSPYGVVFRTNAGEFWQGRRVWSIEFQQYVLTDLQKVTGLPAGFSDLLFVGYDKIAFLEVKTPSGKVSQAQERFLGQMQALGHRAGVARSEEEALKIIMEEMK